ncbi:hypothetical protein ISN45_At03g029800 [Arabidopsis thaliana x Arabidopsis arenosa]|uniref:Uncharacterized protein n=1 Tax=Arabidopsis thaliana x Arabidopsis arenosa TaxID=1240361 RepID=A0A8T2F5G5_9BRAS|nr:hypothetical protein ISN45_At03g029800 [Arabidopsis thaliana x Arabidopsis arenosa]
MSSPHLLCEPPSRLFRLSMQPSSASSLSFSIGELHLFSDEAFPANPAIDHLQISAAPNSDFLNLHNRNSTWNQNLQLRSTDSPHLHLEYKSPHRISRRLQRTISIVELPGRC